MKEIMFSKIIIIGIFIGIALIITGLVWMFASWGYQDYCSTTQIQKLQQAGDYYSCLKEIK